jgi:hypothetical protein
VPCESSGCYAFSVCSEMTQSERGTKAPPRTRHHVEQAPILAVQHHGGQQGVVAGAGVGVHGTLPPSVQPLRACRHTHCADSSDCRGLGCRMCVRGSSPVDARTQPLPLVSSLYRPCSSAPSHRGTSWRGEVALAPDRTGHTFRPSGAQGSRHKIEAGCGTELPFPDRGGKRPG